jgi:hypothetical protein
MMRGPDVLLTTSGFNASMYLVTAYDARTGRATHDIRFQRKHVSKKPNAPQNASAAMKEGDMNMMKIGIYTAIAIVVILVPSRKVRAQMSGDTVAAITKLENESVKSDLSGDKAWPEKYLADDWMGCDSNGKWYTKADLLKMVDDSKNNKYNSEKISDLKVRVYGNTAVATYTDSYDAIVQGEHRTRTILDTDVWVKMGGEWKQVNSQGTTAK